MLRESLFTMKITKTEAKSILTKTTLPGADYVVNPYSGCAFGCTYCYADFTRRFSGHIKDKWGEYIDIKINAPQLLDKEIKLLQKRIKANKETTFRNPKGPVILFSSVTDPYQGAEAKYLVTRECLEVLIKNDFQGEVSILTKSPLVARDTDLFKRLKNVSVGMTITSTDDNISKLIEKQAPIASIRLRALKQLNVEGLDTYACVNPLLPHFADQEYQLRELFSAIQDSGTDKMYIEHLNLSGAKRSRLHKELNDKLDKKVFEKFWLSQTDKYKRELEQVVYKLTKELGIEILGGGVFDHETIKGKTKFVVK